MNPVLLDLPIPILTPRLRLQPRFAGEGRLRNDSAFVPGKLRDTIVTARVEAAGLPELKVSWG